MQDIQQLPWMSDATKVEAKAKGDAARGAKLFREFDCYKCHSVIPWSEMSTGVSPSKPFTVAAGTPLA